jgi:hypothetical protein
VITQRHLVCRVPAAAAGLLGAAAKSAKFPVSFADKSADFARSDAALRVALHPDNAMITAFPHSP